MTSYNNRKKNINPTRKHGKYSMMDGRFIGSFAFLGYTADSVSNCSSTTSEKGTVAERKCFGKELHAYVEGEEQNFS